MPRLHSETVYVQGIQKVSYEITDPQGLIELSSDNFGNAMDSDAIAPTVTQLTLTSKFNPQLSRTPFSRSKVISSSRSLLPEDVKTALDSCQYQYEAVEIVLEWIADAITYTPTQTEEDPWTVLQIRNASCRGLSALAVAALEELGFQAQQVRGYLAQNPDDPHATEGFHRWIKVWFPSIGWVPSSVGFSHNFVDAFHIPLAIKTERLSHIDQPVRTLADLGVTLQIKSYSGGILELDRKTTPTIRVMARRFSMQQRTGLVKGSVITVKDTPVSKGALSIHGEGLVFNFQVNREGKFAVSGLKPGSYALTWTNPPCPPYQQLFLLDQERIKEFQITVPVECAE